MGSSTWQSQLRKGVLEYVLLLLLEREELYGYALIKQLKLSAGLEISEGTVYPILNRLQKEGRVNARWIERDSGVPRKYYQLTDVGRSSLQEMESEWDELTGRITTLRKDR
jgi:PadR family transcriptional regulator